MISLADDGIRISIRAIPNSSKNCILKGNSYIKIKITASPVDNKANLAIIEFLSKELHVAKSNIEIMKGITSKDKIVLLKIKDEITKANIIKKLENVLTNT